VAGPFVGGEDQVAERLGEGPFVVDPLVQGAFGQTPGAGDGLGPQVLDRVPHRAVVPGGPHRSQLHAFGMPLVEFAFHVRSHVDVVDHEALDEPGQMDAHEPRVSDLDLAQVAVPECRASEVLARETGAAEPAGAAAVGRDRQARTDQRDMADKTEPMLTAEPAESTETTEPAEPIDKIEPADPTDRIEPAEPIDRMEPADPMERIDPLEPELRTAPSALVQRRGIFALRMDSFSHPHPREVPPGTRAGISPLPARR
jgi:hypothetical protein